MYRQVDVLVDPDGWTIYAVHGVRVPAWIIEEPQKISVEIIEKEENLEIRRVMIDIYGASKYLQDSGAKLIHECKGPNGDDYQLYRKEIENDEPIVMVKVINATAEPDGTFKKYFLRAHPDITDAGEVVASTFDKTKKDYLPLIET